MSKAKKAEPAKAQPAKAQPPVTQEESTLAEELDVSGAHEVFLRAREKLSAHAPSAAMVKRFRAQISVKDAIEAGVRIASNVLIFDAMTDLPLALDAVIAGQVPGYGPKEAHYTVGLALELDTLWAAFQAKQLARAGVANAKDLSFAAAHRERADLFALLDRAVAPDSDERAALLKAGDFRGKSLTSVAQGLGAVVLVAKKLLTAAESDPVLGEFLADKGLTAAKVKTAAAYSTRLSSAVTAHSEVRSAVDDGGDDLNELDGRLRDELMRLRQGVQQARRDGVKAPEVVLANVRRLYATPRAPGVTPPAPTPAAPTT